jgi:hypothetical protein
LFATGVVDTGDKLAAGIVDTGGKFSTGINDKNLPPVLLIVANLPPLPLIPVVHLDLRISQRIFTKNLKWS